VKYVRLITFVTLVLSTLGLPAAAAFAANATKPSGSASYWTRRTGLNSVGRSPRATSFIATRFPRHSGKPLKVKTARGEIQDDPAFRPTEIYHREATAHVDGKDLPEMARY